MTSKRIFTAGLGVLLGAVGLVFWAAGLQAYPDGVSGKSQSAQGCNCHSTSPNANGAVTVTITGPPAVKPSTTATYTISVSGGPAGTDGGFDLSKTGGTFIPGTGSKILSNDLVHSVETSRSWTFQWTAPATEGVYNFYAVGQPTNGSGTSGDSWNWYGGAVNTAFPINVSSLVGVDGGAGSGLWLGPAAPNPAVRSTRFEFSLAEAGPARLEVFNVSGRRVALLADGQVAAGRHVQTWDGRDDAGRQAASGQYFIRLRAGGASFSRALFLLR